MNPILIGGIVLLVVLFGGAIAYSFISNRNNVEDRLEELVGEGTMFVDEDEPVAVAPKGPDLRERFDKAIVGRIKSGGRIRQRLARADLKLRVSEYLIFMVISAIATAVGAWFFLNQNPVFAGAGVLVGLRIPRMYTNGRAKKRQKLFNEQLGDTLNLWVNALRSGYSVLQGMEAIATELPAPVSSEFERVVQEVRLGLSLENALNNMLERVPSEDLDLVVTAVNIQREVGGNLAEILDIISFTIRERVRIKGEINVLTSQGRMSGWVITLLPIILGLILYAINPDYISQLWIKEQPWAWPNVVPCGWCILGVMFGMIGIGGAAIQKIVDIEV